MPGVRTRPDLTGARVFAVVDQAPRLYGPADFGPRCPDCKQPTIAAAAMHDGFHPTCGPSGRVSVYTSAQGKALVMRALRGEP